MTFKKLTKDIILDKICQRVCFRCDERFFLGHVLKQVTTRSAIRRRGAWGGGG